MRHNIKILHLISSLKRGGRERQLATIVSHTNFDQYPTRIVYFNKYENSYLDEYGLNDFSIRIKSCRKLARLRELHQKLNDEAPDIVYTWGNGESVSILLLKPFHKFTFINGSVRHGIRLKKLSHYLRTIVLHFSEYVVANSKAGLKANNLRRGQVLYNGIDKKFLEPLPNRTATRQFLTGIIEEMPLFISVANLVPYKDYHTILRALKQLKEENYKFYYLILGDGPMRDGITKTIKEYDLTENIKIIGNVENVSDYLKISDFFIHSSRGEGCSNAILEAMATELPIIASDTGGTQEIVSEDNSLLFDYKNHEQLARQIKYCILNPEISSLMGIKSREFVKERFTINIMMSNYCSIINKVLKN